MNITRIKMLAKNPLVYGSLVVIVLLTMWFRGCSTRSTDASATSSAFYTVTKGDLEETVTAQGKLEPRQYVDVGAQVTGQLKKLYFQIGETVKAGELLAEIDPRIYDARVQADNARLKNLKAQRRDQEAQLVLARQRLGREQILVKEKASSIQTVQESQATAVSTEARVESLTGQIEEVESTLSGDVANLGFTKIRAPLNGMVVDLIAREGQTLNANQTAPIILQLADLKTMTVRAQVAEADISRLKSGMDVYFSTLGMIEKKWPGVVRQILPSPEIVNEVVLFDVLIDVDNSSGELMKGMSTQVFFVMGKVADALLIPTEALGRRMSAKDSELGSAYMIKIKTSSGVAEKLVYVGLKTRTQAEVKSGLSVGDVVALSVPSASQTPKASQQPRGFGGPRL